MVEIQSLKSEVQRAVVMFENINGKYKNVSATSGEAFTRDWPARGLSIGDYDNDGDLDVLTHQQW